MIAERVTAVLQIIGGPNAGRTVLVSLFAVMRGRFQTHTWAAVWQHIDRCAVTHHRCGELWPWSTCLSNFYYDMTFYIFMSLQFFSCTGSTLPQLSIFILHLVDSLVLISENVHNRRMKCPWGSHRSLGLELSPSLTAAHSENLKQLVVQFTQK